MTRHLSLALAGATLVVGPGAHAQTVAPRIVHVPLAYGAPAEGRPNPNFSPKGTQVVLTPLGAAVPLPGGAVRPAKTGTIKVGPDQKSWIPVLATASAAHPGDLSLVFLDRNRNGSFADDGPPLSGTPTQNDKTKAWWTSINKIEISVPYTAGRRTEPYLVNVWIVRDDSAPTPDLLRFSVASWRTGTASVNGVNALVAVMDADNNAIFDARDMWSVIGASEPRAEQAVLSIAEARPTERLMFVPTTDGAGKTRDIVLEFRRLAPDGASIDFAVIDKPVTKAADRAPDDLVRDERPRARATVAFVWGHGARGLDAAIAAAKASGKQVFVDFEATWCGPCHTMDQWIWNDAEVAGVLNAGFMGVKIDADLEKALVTRFGIKGYPTMAILDGTGKEVRRITEYQSSKGILAFLGIR